MPGFWDVCDRVGGYKEPEVIWISEKAILTCIIRDKNQEEDENTLDNYKDTGKNRVLILFKADGVPIQRKHT